MISCIIPAAGSSTRMDEWKLMLPYLGKPIIDHVVETALSSADRVLLVTGYRENELRSHFSGIPEIIFLQNPDYSRGMFSSIRTGAAGLDPENFFVLHADLPLVKPSHITCLFDYFTHQRKNKIEIVQPVCNGVPGHPVIFSGSVRETLLRASDSDSMRDIFQCHTVSFFQTNDPAYITDVDTREAYDQLIRQSGS
ncbi:MAG: nucleotidyltransferase family protein [Spirochaetales bacterium]|nr:nucleotidyltransferase family protein [Spirochaetales bacterium]